MLQHISAAMEKRVETIVSVTSVKRVHAKVQEHCYLCGIPYWESALKDHNVTPPTHTETRALGGTQVLSCLFWLLVAKKEQEPRKRTRERTREGCH